MITTNLFIARQANKQCGDRLIHRITIKTGNISYVEYWVRDADQSPREFNRALAEYHFEMLNKDEFVSHTTISAANLQ